MTKAESRKAHSPKTDRPNKFGFKGVKQNGSKFQAQITVNSGTKVNGGVTHTLALGSYDTPAEAYKARVEYIKSLL